LFEREGELAVASKLLTDAADGRGATFLIEGEPGIGKTAVLAAVRSLAGERAIGALTAAGGELEQELPFAIVRQLFESAVRADPALFDGAARLSKPVFGLDGQADAAVGGAVHGLYWLCSNLTERGPLLLAVDDVQWADEASLRFVSHLARRIVDLPVLLVLCGRPRRPDSALSRALTGTQPVTTELRPLSESAVGQIVRERMSAAAEDEFCVACARASGGNPFLLAEALTSLLADAVSPVAAEAGRVEHLRQRTISFAVLTRLARLGSAAVRFARALAVLGTAAELRQVSRLAEVDPATAADLADALARESVITTSRPLEFVHPLVRTAVYADGSDSQRAAWHKRAALILRDDDAPPELLMPHLLATEPESDPFVVESLRAAASDALARGAAETAAACLHRALAEPPRPGQRVELYAEYGRATAMANRADEAAMALRTAHDLAGDPLVRGELALELGALMVQTGRAAEAVQTFELARRAIMDRNPADVRNLPLRLHVALAMAGFAAMEPPASWIDRLESLVAEPGSETEADRMILACLAFVACASGARPAELVGDLASRAAQGPLPAEHQWLLVNFASTSLVMADRIPEALALLDRGIESTTARGDVSAFRYLSVLRSHTAFHGGRLREAEADGRAALMQHEIDYTTEAPLAAAMVVDALTEQGSLDEAQTVLTEGGLENPARMNMLIDHFVLMARGRLRLRQGRPREALTDLLACGEVMAGAGYVNPAFAPWRPEAALAQLALGDRAAAVALATEDLALARRFGARRAIGIALRAKGLSEGIAGLELLEEAVGVLEAFPGELDLARALVDYGSALRRSGLRTKAQEHLRRGLDIAARCAAHPVAERANDELIASGARPRRAQLTGPHALTASELRVVRLAADGITNREIAQTLFVTKRTIEVHLTSSYRKLGINSRQQLKAALDEGLLG
jgi:DNA-binding CsgD family transcriptional regulator